LTVCFHQIVELKYRYKQKKIPKQKLFNVDLYSFSVTSPTTEVVPSIETIPKQDQDSPVIYPWMRKVHINNPG
jgi:hypothetical protein